MSLAKLAAEATDIDHPFPKSQGGGKVVNIPKTVNRPQEFESGVMKFLPRIALSFLGEGQKDPGKKAVVNKALLKKNLRKYGHLCV